MSQLAVIGLGTMGANLARNAARNGAKVPVYNRTTEKMQEFMNDYADEGEFVGCETLEELVQSMERPRPIMIMVKAGGPVDAVIDQLLPLLDEDDIIIDGGNSHYPDTDRRVAELKEKGIHFLGIGVSGGEEGALLGPSMMPGGTKESYAVVEPLLQQMSADDYADGKCVAYVGDGGAGHFVKMVHNGIEYGVMQLIAESYDLLKTLGEFSNEELAETYHAWNEGAFLNSFLVEITAQIFEKADDQGEGHLVDKIADRAKQKGTGKWTTFAALDYGVAIPTITAAVDARIMSGSTDLREKRKDLPVSLNHDEPIPKGQQLRSAVRAALKQSVICSYVQGIELMQAASDEEGWNLNMSEIARIWTGGCIIRSSLLEKLEKAYGSDKNAAAAAKEVILDRFGVDRQRDWRKIISIGASHGVPLPAMSASLSYYDTLRKDRLPQALVQAQRDFFGAHTFERIDKEGTFHADWIQN